MDRSRVHLVVATIAGSAKSQARKESYSEGNISVHLVRQDLRAQVLTGRSRDL